MHICSTSSVNKAADHRPRCSENVLQFTEVTRQLERGALVFRVRTRALGLHPMEIPEFDYFAAPEEVLDPKLVRYQAQQVRTVHRTAHSYSAHAQEEDRRLELAVQRRKESTRVFRSGAVYVGEWSKSKTVRNFDN